MLTLALLALAGCGNDGQKRQRSHAPADTGDSADTNDSGVLPDFISGDPIATLGSDGDWGGGGGELVEWVDAVVLDDSYGLVVGQGGLATVNLADGSITAHLPVKRGYRVAATGERAIVGTRSQGLMLFAISDPAAPSMLIDHPLGMGYHEDVAIDGDRVLVGWQENGGLLLDLDLNELGRLPATSAVGVGLFGDRAVLTDGAELVLFDISDEAVPVELSRAPLPGEGRDVSFDGDRVAVGMGGSGVSVFDVLGDTLVDRGSFSTPGSALSVSVDGDWVWVGAWEVTALAWIGGEEPVVIGHESPVASAMAVGARDGRAVVADWFFSTALQRAEGVAGPEIVAQESAWFDAGETAGVRFENDGIFDLDVTVDAPGGGYAVEATAFTLAPGEVETLLVTAPTGEIPDVIDLNWHSNDPDESDGRTRLRRSNQGVGTTHDDFSLQGFTWPDGALDTYALSEQRGSVVFLAYFALY